MLTYTTVPNTQSENNNLQTNVAFLLGKTRQWVALSNENILSLQDTYCKISTTF